MPVLDAKLDPNSPTVAQFVRWMKYSVASAIQIRDARSVSTEDAEVWNVVGEIVQRAIGNRHYISCESVQIMYESVLLWSLRACGRPELNEVRNEQPRG